ncbi:MAG: hypothetical protein A2Z31_10115 [candidate division NC10 bacterium RBG_16_65_8]|nr:MAG: hypothetical protein A2Z31_10115 [candidate division NC10 bacterium RBG_16_65_8]
MFCPKCGAEFREGFASCADCKVDLVMDSPQLEDRHESGKCLVGSRRNWKALVTDRDDSYRILNGRIAYVAMAIIFLVYAASAGRAPLSDNVGVIVVPIVLFLTWGPAVSLLCGLIQAALLKRSGQAADKSYLRVVASTQPPLFVACGKIGLVLLALNIVIVVASGQYGLWLPLLPFWAIEYLF